MKKPLGLKKPFCHALAAASLAALVQTTSADILFSDNFNIGPGGNPDANQNLNFDLADRQAGPLAPATYSGLGGNHQVGNTGTYVGQPGGATNGGYVLTAINGNWQSDLNLAVIVAGPLTIDFDLYELTNSASDWGACSLRGAGSAFPVAGSGEFGFLRRHNGGVQVFQNGGAISSVASWDTPNFALDPHWKLIFTDTAGTGSAFNGNGSVVTIVNGATTLGTITLNQLNRAGLKLGFDSAGGGDSTTGGFAGIDNLAISGTLAPTIVAVSTAIQSGSNPFTPTWTAETPNLIAGMLPTTAAGNFNEDGNLADPSVLTDGAIGISGTEGGFVSCGGSAATTLIYSLTNSVNGSDVTNIVVYSGWGDGGRYGQYYDLSYSTVSAPTTYIPITTVFSIPGDYTGAPSLRVDIAKAGGAPLASGVANLKFDFTSPPNANGFNNGWQGYSEIIVQGTNTAQPPPPPSGYLTQDTLPGYAETVVGDQVVFSAGFSNFPPVNLQWQFIAGGATNNLTAGVVNVTNNDNVTSTLTLNNVQTSSSGLYRLQANNATNSAAATSYSTASKLAVGPTPAPINNVIVNYAGQTFSKSAAPNYFPAWPVDTNDLNLIAGFTSGTGPGTFTYLGDFTGGGNYCNADPTVLTDGFATNITSLPNLAFCAGGPLIDNVGYEVTYTLNPATYGMDLTNVTVFGGWQDGGRNEQKYQVLYATVQSPSTLIPLITADYQPTDTTASASVSRTTLVPASGVLAHNVAVVQISFNVSPGPENGWEGYSEILVGGQPSTGFVPALTNDVAPTTASDVVGGQIVMTAGFSGATSVQWQKNGTNLPGATATTLTLANLQITDAGVYSLVGRNSSGNNSSSGCTVVVYPAPTAVGNIVTAIAAQTSVQQLFAPTWDASKLANSLIYNMSPSSSGDVNADFTGGSFNSTPTGGSQPTVLTDGTFGTVDFNQTGTHACFTCMGTGTGTGGNQGGNYVIYTLPASANGYDLTNIMTSGGWNDGGRDQQAYTVNYATADNPTYFTPLAMVNYTPTNPVGYSVTRATLTAANGVLVRNVVALEFDMTVPYGENGFEGYSQIAVYGSPSTTPPPARPSVTVQHEEVTDSFTLASPSLIANQLPSSAGPGTFTEEGCNVTNLTSGQLGFGYQFGASCGDDGIAVPWIIYRSTNGWNLTNIVVYTMWNDYGRDGQFYNLSYSTLSAPTTFQPLTSVAYNPPVPQNGTASGNQITIAPAPGQSLLASNVYAVKFDFTPQGTQDYSWSGYTQIVLQGSNLTAPLTGPTITSSMLAGGNLIVTGVGGTPNLGYVWLTSTDLLTPFANWTAASTGTLDGTGAFSNSIPVNPSQRTGFFRLWVP